MSEKKNQHYIPKFYLRNFSYQNNGKEIGIYNLLNDFFVSKGKLKTQGSKNFFYGQDCVIENELANIENLLAQQLNKITSDEEIPKKLTKEHIDLLLFVCLTDLRNPVRINSFKNGFIEMGKRLSELDPNIDLKNFIPILSHDDAVKMSMSGIKEVIEEIVDLDFKILKNTTKQPFLTSDFPIVKYNQFLENRNWHLSKSGYGLSGLQIFIPLNSELMLLFYDSEIYKIGDKKQKIVLINDLLDIENLNILQFVNCFGNIYFNEKTSEEYIRKLVVKAKKYKRANESTAHTSYLINKNTDNINEIRKGKENLIIIGSIDVETKLKISQIKIHSKGQYKKLNSSASQLRKHCEKRMMEKRNYR
jgi:polyhydroxyalkanoate synthesis regulator phasin